ncbi:sigma-70 family RNA polymerase sigma factor [Amycolatopsis sp. K13G38]|uniref:Sigma-70 family RNA polymerase sigma factor n=1 Tax=Amycolatopsis acididurans TaxID=2724524 RepID=A0ABX1J5X9_9PSEU|nr:sigma-70 family RNA polymerase sigma factor [Amycolatopsis acididurans]NKQ55064.1 sigma-70 family RNA polymerase sigma factor [Amycolatopsis acididurans]
MTETDIGELLTRALGGDQAAWRSLVRGLSALVLHIARSYRLGDADAHDICQNTWLTLAQRSSALRDPAKLPGWLATTARRQALRTISAARREIPSDGHDAVGPLPSPEHAVLSSERDRVLWRAVGTLPERDRTLIRLLATQPELTHTQLAQRIGVAPGTIGPLRRRTLDRLRRALEAQGYDHA